MSTICYPCATHTSEVRMKFSASGGLLPNFLKRLCLFCVCVCVCVDTCVKFVMFNIRPIWKEGWPKTTRDVRTDSFRSSV